MRSSKNKRKTKSTNKVSATSSNVASAAVASTSANSGEGWHEEVRDGIILGLNFVRDLSESTDLLAPLKGASALVIRGLETARVRSCANAHGMCRLIDRDRLCKTTRPPGESSLRS
jgi:predicted RNA-binding Zn ribbon-like protein